ncbi:hypothetical protein [Cytobacillus sp. IB215665]|uniref:hypothetical protein n=1 Tax=Cytobacillus sp. IB215665 TaxID=3097357 RepID=UPI002A17606D|nr:hypothetical protein [Cytobacillus sp. IB215665]MDX8364229.1 hypothetical protein [Cytobacillus sp. IB215665]
MEYAIVILFAIAIILLIVSFVSKDKVSDLEKQIEQLSLSVMQDNYQVKKKLKILEEELLVNDSVLPNNIFQQDENLRPKATHDAKHEQIQSLLNLGQTVEEIAKETSLTIEEVGIIVNHISRMRGDHVE